MRGTTLSDGSVTAAKLAPGVVPVAPLPDGSVTSVKLADGAVVTAKLAVRPDLQHVHVGHRVIHGRDVLPPGQGVHLIGGYAPSTHSCIDPSNGQSPLVYRAAIVAMPDQAPLTT